MGSEEGKKMKNSARLSILPVSHRLHPPPPAACFRLQSLLSTSSISGRNVSDCSKSSLGVGVRGPCRTSDGETEEEKGNSLTINTNYKEEGGRERERERERDEERDKERETAKERLRDIRSSRT